MLTRTKKQISYGALYLAALVGVVALVVLPSTGPSKAIPSPTPTSLFAPIEIEEVTVIPHPIDSNSPTRTVDIVASLKNPNLRAGVGDYTLSMVLLDPAGQEITTTQETTYILPGARHFITALNVTLPVDQRLGRAEITPPQNPQFVSLPEQLKPPQFNLFLRDRTEATVAGRLTQTQTGIVTNTSTFDWERVEVAAIGRDADGTTIATGTTFIGRLGVGEQREFSIEWPKPSTDITQVIAIPSTNMFRQENIVQIIGNPETLR